MKHVKEFWAAHSLLFWALANAAMVAWDHVFDPAFSPWFTSASAFVAGLCSAAYLLDTIDRTHARKMRAKLEALKAKLAARPIPPRFHNFHRHDDCPVKPGVEWDTYWSSACDDECPECGVAIAPYDYEEES